MLHNPRVLSWKVHPPTAYCFAKHVLFLLPYTSVSLDVRYDILELTKFFTELSVIDYYFVGQRPSSVALGALFNSMAAMPNVSDEAIDDLRRELRIVPALDLSHDDVEGCRSRLRVLYTQGGYERPETQMDSEGRNDTTSPVCVSYGVNSEEMPYHNEAKGGSEIESAGETRQFVNGFADAD